jgi:hypothetical protein
MQVAIMIDRMKVAGKMRLRGGWETGQKLAQQQQTVATLENILSFPKTLDATSYLHGSHQ